jgi:large subunit ribosomal protein L10
MRQEKQLLLDDIKEKMDASSAFILTRYNSLTPDLSAEFRNNLREAGGSYSVVKKRILMKAAEAGGVTLDPSALDGHIAVVFAEEDPMPTTKALFAFAKDRENTLEVLAGQIEGELCSAEEVKAFSQLPSKDEMRSQFIGLLEAPMSQTLSVMEALLTSLMHCMENKSQKETE